MKPDTNNDLYWVFTLSLQPEDFEEFKELVARIVRESAKEPGTLAYQYSVNEDKTTVHIFERYQNSSAFVSHVENTFAQFAEQFLALVSVVSLTVYGAPDASARKALDSFNAVYMTIFDGFSK
jgi:quinol monooxygenase YgiN